MRIVWFDLETGGVEPHHPDIQLAAIATDDFKELESFECKIQFDPAACDPEALELNSYTVEGWREAIPEAEAVARFAEFLERHRSIQMIGKKKKPFSVARLAGHNVSTFDAPRLLAMFQRQDKFLAADAFRPVDTLQLALWWALKNDVSIGYAEPLESTRLEALVSYFNVTPEGDAHDALADVRTTIAVASRMVEFYRPGRAA